MPNVDYGDSRSVSHNLHRHPSFSARSKGWNAFLVALRSPFNISSSAAIPPAAALCEMEHYIYSLFFDGFIKCTMYYNSCQVIINNIPSMFLETGALYYR